MTGPTPDTADRIEHRFYGELAEWWPLISPLKEYAEEGAYFATVLLAPTVPGGWGGVGAGQRRRARRLLPAGPLPADAGRPRPPDMLTVKPAAEPRLRAQWRATCARSGWGAQFDAVFIHDAIMYMTSEADLLLAIRDRPSNIVGPAAPPSSPPTARTETDEQYTRPRWRRRPRPPAGRPLPRVDLGSRPRPTTGPWPSFAFVLREADGTVPRRPPRPTGWGVFSRGRVAAADRPRPGFAASAHNELPTGDDHPRTWFVGRRAA